MEVSKRHKDKQSLTQYVMAEEARKDMGDNATSSPKSSMFNRLQPSTPQQHPIGFSTIGNDMIPKPSMFQRLQGGK